MRFSTLLTTAAAAGFVSAAPVEKRAVVTDWVVKVVTSYTTVYPGAAPTSAPVASPAAAVVSPIAALQKSAAPAVPTPAVVAPQPSIVTPSVKPAPPPVQTSQPEAAPAPVSSGSQSTGSTTAGHCSAWSAPSSLDSPIVNCGVSVLDVANKWRRKYGKSEFSWSSNIAAASRYTGNANRGGVTMKHVGLTNGAMGECITPGFWETGTLATQGLSPFEVALLGWLCEVKSDPELSPENNNGIDVCEISSKVASISGSVDGGAGHHDIFLGDYSKFGAWYENDANGDGGWQQYAGQWTADFA